MALINKLEAIGDAIRNKTGQTEKLTLEGMVEAINSLSTGGGTIQYATITRSGKYSFDLSNYVDNNSYILFYEWGGIKCMHIPGAQTVNTISRKGGVAGRGIETITKPLDNISDEDTTVAMWNNSPNVITENNIFKLDYTGVSHVGVSAILVYVG